MYEKGVVVVGGLIVFIFPVVCVFIESFSLEEIQCKINALYPFDHARSLLSIDCKKPFIPPCYSPSMCLPSINYDGLSQVKKGGRPNWTRASFLSLPYNKLDRATVLIRRCAVMCGERYKLKPHHLAPTFFTEL